MQKPLFLLFLGILTDNKSETQDQDWDEELQNLDDEFWCLVLVVRGLSRCNVCPCFWNTRRIDLANVVLLHHVPCGVAVSNVFKVIRSIFPCNNNRNISLEGFNWIREKLIKINFVEKPVEDNKTSSPPG